MTATVAKELLDLLSTTPPLQLESTDSYKGRSPLPPKTCLGAGRYILGELIGQGSFGLISAAIDTRSNQVIAIKEFFPAECSRHPQRLFPLAPKHWSPGELSILKEQFKQEYSALERFARPGIVKVYDLFEENGGLFMVMERLTGRTLDNILKEHQSLSEAQATYVVGRLAATLQAIHLSGLVHGDIKPENLFLTNSAEIILLDFGSVNRYLSHDKKAPKFLTPGYASPEVYQANQVTHPASDVYAVGATFYELLTGHAPPESIERLEGVRLPSPSYYGKDVSPETIATLTKLLALPKDKRPQNASELTKLIAQEDGEVIADPSLLQPLAPWIGHASSLRHLVVTQDGEHLASADKSGQLRLWSLKEACCIGVIEFGVEIIDLAVNFNGSIISIALGDGRVSLLDFASGRVLENIRDQIPFASCLAFSPNQDLLACGLATGEVVLYQIGSLQKAKAIRDPKASINSIAFSSSGRLIALASNDRTLSIFDLKTKKRIRHFSAFTRPVQSVVFYNKGQFIISGGGDLMLKIFDVRHDDLFRTLKGHEAMVWSIEVIDEYELALSCSNDRQLRLWDLRSFKELGHHQAGEGWLQTLAYHPASKTIYTGGAEGVIYRYQLSELAIKR